MSVKKDLSRLLKKNAAYFNLQLKLKTMEIAKRAFEDRSLPLILVYQMGKVGSTSTYDAIKRSGIPNHALHLHFISKDIKRHLEVHRAEGIKHRPYHLALGLAVQKQLSRHPDQVVKIISLVRDPIAWYVSVLFEPPYFEKELLDEGGQIDAGKASAYIKSTIENESSFTYMTEWFDREIKAVFGIDVFAEPFDRSLGHKLYKKDNTELLLIRLEDLNRQGPGLIKDFLGMEEAPEIGQRHTRDEKPEATIYKQVVKNLRLTREECMKVYAMPFARHFYDEAQIDTFISRWCP